MIFFENATILRIFKSIDKIRMYSIQQKLSVMLLIPFQYSTLSTTKSIIFAVFVSSVSVENRDQAIKFIYFLLIVRT